MGHPQIVVLSNAYSQNCSQTVSLQKHFVTKLYQRLKERFVIFTGKDVL
jgi:hypothetical protein